MSTTIYNGYKLKRMNILKMFAFMKKFRREVEGLAGNMISKVLARHIVEMIDDMAFLDEETYVDRHVLYPPELDKRYDQLQLEKKGIAIDDKERVKLTMEAYTYRNPFTVAYRKAEQRYVEIGRKDERDPEIDMDCRVVIFPIKRKLFGKIPFGVKLLAIFDSEQKEYYKHWKDQNEVSFYGYWNNVDPEEGVSDRAWKRRELDWDEAIPGRMVEDAFRFDIVKGFPSRMVVKPETVLSHIPSLEERANRIASQLLIDRKYRELKTMEVEDQKKDDTDQHLSIYNKASGWLRSDEGKKQLVEDTQRIMPQLVSEITKSHVTTSFHELYKTVKKD